MRAARHNGRAAALLMMAILSILPRAAAADEAREVRFLADVAPVLVQKCQGCHGPDKPKGGYRLDTFDRLMKPGDGGTAPVTPGDPADSELFRRVTAHDPKKRMPQKDDPLPPAQVALIEQWVRGGAKFDGADRTAPLSLLVPSAQHHPPAPQAYPRPVPVLALAFRPGGAELAAGGHHEVTFWDPTDGRLLRRVGDVARQTHGLAYSPDGTLLAAASGTPGSIGEVRFIPVPPAGAEGTPPPPRVLDRIGDAMLAVSFSPDGKKLAAGGTDGAVRVYDVATGKRLLLIEQHADWVTAVAFSPDGKHVASASRDKTARVFDATTGEMQGAYVRHEAPLFAAAWTGDGKHVVTGGRDREVHLWEPTTEGKTRGEIKGFGGDVLRLAVAGDAVYTCAADGKVRRHKLTGERPLERTYEGAADWAYGLAVDEKRGRVAAGAFDGTVRVYKADDGTAVTTFVAAPGFVPPK